MPKLYNTSAQYRQAAGPENPAVAPGEAHDFTDDEAASIDAEWSATDPHAGLAAEKAWKAKRDNKTEASPAPEENTESGNPGDTKEN